MAVLEELVARLRGRYVDRPAEAVAVHELLAPAWRIAEGRETVRDEYPAVFLVGELVEAGIKDVLEATVPRRVTRRVTVAPFSAELPPLLDKAGVGYSTEGDAISFTVTGRTDLLVPGMGLVEVKTTRKRELPGYASKWMLQAALYAWLYGEPVRLVIVALSSVDDHYGWEAVMRPSERLAECVLRTWANMGVPAMSCGQVLRKVIVDA